MPRLRHLLPALLLLALPLLSAQAYEGVDGADEAAQPPAFPPLTAIIIDDLGDRLAQGLRAIDLPGNITYAILPQTPYSTRFARLAHSRGKEVMLHQPMQAIGGKAIGPGGLTLHMTRKAFTRTLRANLLSVPYARGVNNHMGSLLTRHPGQMAWLMAELQRRELYFIDSKTTNQSVAQKVAMEQELPNLRRNIFLDHDRTEASVRRQFLHFVAQARAVGSSVAIGHPYPETLLVLEEMLPMLEEQGIQLLPVSALITERNKRRERLWQASLSPSPTGVKSSKQ